MIYLDNNATTRPDERVLAAMDAALRETWANPSSVHRPGQAARRTVELAREQVGALIGARPKSITFTSGGTEAIDLAIRGTLAARRAGPGHADAGAARPVIVTTPIEHSAVRELCEALAKDGAVEVRRLPLDGEGVVPTDALEGAITPGIALVSVQWANNETGAVQPVAAIGRACRASGVRFHCDATQWVGRMETDVGEAPGPAGVAGRAGVPAHARIDCDLLTFAPHKFHGPKGVGVLWARGSAGLVPGLVGVQERGRRGGTENVPGIAGAGAAAAAALEFLADPSRRDALAALRDRLERAVIARVPDAVLLGPRTPERRLWTTASIAFPRLEAEAILLLLSERGVCASAGAACSSGSLEPSPVLLAMGVPPEVAHGAVRFSISRETTPAEIDEAARMIGESIARLRGSGAG